MDLYIYYQVEVEHAPSVQARVGVAQASLHAHTRVKGLLKRRPEAKDGRHTWMEIYPDVPAGFEPLLDGAIAQSGLLPLIAGARHTEYFVDHSPCA